MSNDTKTPDAWRVAVSDGYQYYAFKPQDVRDPEPLYTALSALGTAPAGPVAWMGYWPGAGSVNSETFTTHRKHEMEQWRENGAEITPLVPASPVSAVVPAVPPQGMEEPYWSELVTMLVKETERTCGPGPAVDAVRLRLASHTPANAAEIRATHQHVKRGTEYMLIGYGKMQAERWEIVPELPSAPIQKADMAEVAIYRSVDDGSLWVRPREEFEDGRFRALSEATANGK